MLVTFLLRNPNQEQPNLTLFQKFVKILCTDFPTVKFLPRNPNQAFHEPKPNLNKHLVRLKVGGENQSGKEAQVTIRVAMVKEYPSHLPPRCEVLEGVPGIDGINFVSHSLLSLFYKEQANRMDGEDPTGVVHNWTEWLRDEWIAKQDK